MADHQSFVGFTKKKVTNQAEENLESLERKGYFVVENLFSEAEVARFRQKMDDNWKSQLAKYGKDLLRKIGDYGVARAMMQDDSCFLDLIIDERIFPYVELTVGETAILHLQNGILLFSDKQHNQARYHKDFPKDFIPSKILSFNAFLMVDDFNESTGGTWVIPGSHKYVELPSEQYIEQNQVQVQAPAGSVLFFDSMLWHKGGWNKSGKPRRGINNQYTKPFIKQQLDYPAFLKDKIEKESKIAQTLGMWTVPPKGVDQYRVTDPSLRTYRGGQG